MLKGSQRQLSHIYSSYSRLKIRLKLTINAPKTQIAPNPMAKTIIAAMKYLESQHQASPPLACTKMNSHVVPDPTVGDKNY